MIVQTAELEELLAEITRLVPRLDASRIRVEDFISSRATDKGRRVDREFELAADDRDIPAWFVGERRPIMGCGLTYRDLLEILNGQWRDDDVDRWMGEGGRA